MRPGDMMQGGADERATNSQAVLRRTLAFLLPYRVQLIFVLGLIVVYAAAQGLGPALIGQALNVFVAHKDLHGLTRTMGLLFGVYIVGFLAQTGQSFLMGSVGQRFIADLRARIFDKVQVLPLSYFDKNRAGDVMSRLVNDTSVISQLISQGLVQAIGSIFSLVGIIIAMLLISPLLALASFIVIPIMIFVTIFFARRSRQAYRQTRTSIGAVSEDLEEEIAGVRVAQAFNRTESNVERFAVRNAANRDANVQAVAITSAFSPTIDILSTLATIIVAAFGGWLAVRHQIAIGTVVAFFLYVQQFFRPIQIISSIATQVQGALAGAERIFGLIDEPAQEHDAPGAEALPTITGQVVFADVAFSYTGKDDPTDLVLHDINLEARPGQTVALVGPTGAGKSTLVNLIPRFYNPVAGRVLIDGHDSQTVTLASLRRQMGIVLQESFLFSGTIGDNIRYGKLDATQAEVEAAARAVSAHDFISALPEGYDTKLGERGGGLSQGQRQLLSFARAVLADPRILILDEATASVDTRTETIIQEALKTLLRGRTSFVIAHRLSTVHDADQILVIDAGRIIERGNHAELLAQGGLYADLYQRQFRDTPTPVGVGG